MLGVLLVLFGLSICGLVFSIYMLFRNEWVYASRAKLWQEDSKNFDRYLSYQEMMFKFWVWDIEKLKKLQ